MNEYFVSIKKLNQCAGSDLRVDAMTHSWRDAGPVALRPTWKVNLIFLVVVLIVVFAIAS